jgi:hypothetical protein
VLAAVKKGEKRKEEEKVSTTHKSSIPTTNTIKSVEHTKSTVVGTTIKKPRKKETILRASVLGTDNTEKKKKKQRIIE